MILLLLACAHLALPPATPGEDPAVLLSRAVAPNAPLYAPWRTWGPCVALYSRWGAVLPVALRCGPRWARVEDAWDVVELLRGMPNTATSRGR